MLLLVFAGVCTVPEETVKATGRWRFLGEPQPSCWSRRRLDDAVFNKCGEDHHVNCT